MSLVLLLAVPAALALLLLAAGPAVRRHPLAAGVALAVLGVIGAATALSWSQHGQVLAVALPWVPTLDVSFAVRSDSFRSLFVALINLTAAGVLLFAASAYRSADRLPGLLATLVLFWTAMLGIVVADDFIVLFLFWESTSILSFILVGWYYQREESRWKATQGLLVTGLGGLALLAGLVLLRMASGTSSFGALAGMDLSGHPLAPAIILLVALGALTKSAQFPFHFWLPNAMAGPTPVSAFLHSATMVKAGVFLLAILAPVLAAHPLWTPLFLTCGFLTVGAAVVRGWNERDLKAVLACTTLAALGHLTILAGLGTPAALQAFLIFLLAHALYKAPLFLAAGTLEEAFGTRDLTRLRGSGRLLPATGLAMAVALLSLFGVPVLPGFVGKEYFLKSAWNLHPALALLGALSFAAIIALTLRAFLPLFSRGSRATPRQRPGRSLQASLFFSTAGALLLTLAFPLAATRLFPSAEAALGAADLDPLKLWPGLSIILGLSLAALGLGAVVARATGTPRSPDDRLPSAFDSFYHALVGALGRGAGALATLLQERRMATHLALVTLASGLLVGWQLLVAGLPLPSLSLGRDEIVPTLLAVLIALAGLGAASARSRLELLTLLGLLGMLIALLFAYFSAPDLALTQLLTETILLVFLVAVLRKRSSFPARTPAPRPAFAMATAILGGIVATALVLKAKALEFTPPVSGYFVERSLPDAFGANVVNVILVDFRALDTLGEIVVLGIAAIGATALLRRLRRPRHLQGWNPTDSSLLRTALPALVTVLLLFAVLFLLRGHNNPGGGFIAALVAGTAFTFVALGGARSRISRLDLTLILSGLGLAGVTAGSALLVGHPFLSGLWIHPDLPGGSPFHLGTPLLFDLGVLLTVLGFVLAFLRRFLPATRSTTWN